MRKSRDIYTKFVGGDRDCLAYLEQATGLPPDELIKVSLRSLAESLTDDRALDALVVDKLQKLR